MRTSFLLLGVFLFTSNALRERNPLRNITTLNHKRDGVIEMHNWAGAGQNASGSNVFQTITAQWQVPRIYDPPGDPSLADSTINNPVLLGEWTGFTGDCGVIVQAGTSQTVSRY
jgi:hypothetical protein